MSVSPGVVQCPFLVLVSQQRVGASLHQNLDHFQIALGCGVENAALTVGVLAVDLAACVDKEVCDDGCLVVLGAVEEGSLHIVVILIEVEAYPQKIGDYPGLLQPSSVVQCPLLEVVLVLHVAPYLPEKLDQVQRLLLALHVDQFEEYALAGQVVDVGQVCRPGVVLHNGGYSAELAALDALVEPEQAILRVTHIQL